MTIEYNKIKMEKSNETLKYVKIINRSIFSLKIDIKAKNDSKLIIRLIAKLIVNIIMVSIV